MIIKHKHFIIALILVLISALSFAEDRGEKDFSIAAGIGLGNMRYFFFYYKLPPQIYLNAEYRVYDNINLGLVSSFKVNSWNEINTLRTHFDYEIPYSFEIQLSPAVFYKWFLPAGFSLSPGIKSQTSISFTKSMVTSQSRGINSTVEDYSFSSVYGLFLGINWHAGSVFQEVPVVKNLEIDLSADFIMSDFFLIPYSEFCFKLLYRF